MVVVVVVAIVVVCYKVTGSGGMLVVVYMVGMIVMAVITVVLLKGMVFIHNHIALLLRRVRGKIPVVLLVTLQRSQSKSVQYEIPYVVVAPLLCGQYLSFVISVSVFDSMLGFKLEFLPNVGT